MQSTLELNKFHARGKQYAQHPIKVTALAYIREALQDERYEEIRDMIAIAKEFGASEWDLRIAFIPGFTK